MKLRKINILLAIALSSSVAFVGCSKDDGAIPKRIGIEDVPVITINTANGAIRDSIAFARQGAFAGAFKVALFFANALPPTSVDVVVRKNHTTAVPGSVRVFKTGTTTLPANFTVSAADIRTLFGDTLKRNDTYDFAPDIYVGTKKYEAFPAAAVGSGQGVTGMSQLGFGEFVRYTVR